ncbi:MAG: BamA/TamA family outer membrane protein [Myxococcaceae bacterium]|nr:BamA/TamA family outer membrane protein [Myxococcaceae bacterium]
MLPLALMVGRVVTAGLGFELSPADAGASVELTPVAAPAYTPELGLLVAGGAVLSWHGDPERRDLPRSSLNAVAGVSTTGAFLVQGRLQSSANGDRLRVTAALEVRDQPDHYFGVGYENGASRPLGADTTLYRRTWWQLTPTLLLRVLPFLYVGVPFDLSSTRGRDLSAGVAADPDFRSEVQNTGVGLTVQYDTRDVPINAWSGMLLSATWLGYARALGGTTEWHALSFDYRQYVQLFRKGSTLAWQFKHRSTFGDVPWSDLTQVGTPWDLRAYRWGQFRDRSGTSAVVEYRFMLPFEEGSLWARLGLVAWVGAGLLGPGVLPDFKNVLPAAGGGLRVELQQRITMRLDVGFGDGTRAVYFNFLEAF